MSDYRKYCCNDPRCPTSGPPYDHLGTLSAEMPNHTSEPSTPVLTPEDDLHTLWCAVENMRLAPPLTDRQIDAKWNLAYKLEQMANRLYVASRSTPTAEPKKLILTHAEAVEEDRRLHAAPTLPNAAYRGADGWRGYKPCADPRCHHYLCEHGDIGCGNVGCPCNGFKEGPVVSPTLAQPDNDLKTEQDVDEIAGTSAGERDYEKLSDELCRMLGFECDDSVGCVECPIRRKEVAEWLRTHDQRDYTSLARKLAAYADSEFPTIKGYEEILRNDLGGK